MRSFTSLFFLVSLLSALNAVAAVPGTSRQLKQATRAEVVRRMSPDRTWSAKRQGTSPVPISCGNGFFNLQYTGSKTSDDTQYAYSATTGDNNLVTATPTLADAAEFYLNSACNLVLNVGTGLLANMVKGVTQADLYFSGEDIVSYYGYIPAVCSVSGNSLSCTDQTAGTFYVCANALELHFGKAVPAGCGAVTFNVLPIA